MNSRGNSSAGNAKANPFAKGLLSSRKFQLKPFSPGAGPGGGGGLEGRAKKTELYQQPRDLKIEFRWS